MQSTSYYQTKYQMNDYQCFYYRSDEIQKICLMIEVPNLQVDHIYIHWYLKSPSKRGCRGPQPPD